VLGFKEAFVDVFVVVVEIVGFKSSRLSLGGGGDFRWRRGGLLEAFFGKLSRVNDLAGVQTEPGVE
jgi:hypothetical protein